MEGEERRGRGTKRRLFNNTNSLALISTSVRTFLIIMAERS